MERIFTGNYKSARVDPSNLFNPWPMATLTCVD
jgi:hypothetical protein